MKAITLKHPWAFAVARLGKDVENRTWKPPKSLIGQRIAIHGGREPTRYDLDECKGDINFICGRILTPADIVRVRHSGYNQLKKWITPGIVATATLERVVDEFDSPWFFGPWGWVLGDVRPLDEPIACKGAQGLWDVPEPIARLIEAGSLK